MGSGGSDDHAPRGLRQFAGLDLPDVPLTDGQLDAIANFHSGMAQVSVQEWAILVRCRSERPVEADELVCTLLDWFEPMLSVGEITSSIGTLVDREFLVRCSDGSQFRTSARGEQVLHQAQLPLVKGTIWMLANKDDEGDRHVDQ